MKGKNILITGASKGIGAKTAEYLSGQGATVVLVARNKEKLEKIQDKLSSQSYVFLYDFNDLESIRSIFDYCAEQGIKLNGMVHCAGVNRDVPIRNNDVGWMQETFRVNYMSFIELAKNFVRKKYSEDGSSIVAISSYATHIISAGMCTYTSSKAALEAAVKVMAKEFVKRKIRTNAILPACVDTEMVVEAPFLEYDSISASQPLGLIEPEYISNLAEFLLSDKAKYITGALIPVSAGLI